jgi:hypothetical protein
MPAILPLRVGDEVRKLLGRRVIDSISRVSQGLPRPVLETEVPDPETVLASFVIDDRTRNVLERARPFGGSHGVPSTTSWTLSRYLDVPRFGPHCLVDLLAARAEAGRRDCSPRRSHVTMAAPATETPKQAFPSCPTWLPIDEVSSFLLRSMPLSGEQIGEYLVREGMAPRSLSLDELVRAYRSAGQVPPFRIVRCGASEAAVPASMHGIANTVAVTAKRFVSWWGLASVQSVAARAQVRAQLSGPTRVTIDFAGRVLASFQHLVWLDEAKEWFSFRERESCPLTDAVKKEFLVSEWVPMSQMRLALAKVQPQLAALPGGAAEQYLSQIVGCRIIGGWATLSQPSSAPQPTAAASPQSREQRPAQARPRTKLMIRPR